MAAVVQVLVPALAAQPTFAEDVGVAPPAAAQPTFAEGKIMAPPAASPSAGTGLRDTSGLDTAAASPSAGSRLRDTSGAALLHWAVTSLLRRRHPYLALDVLRCVADAHVAGAGAELAAPLVRYCVLAGSDHAAEALLAALPPDPQVCMCENKY